MELNNDHERIEKVNHKKQFHISVISKVDPKNIPMQDLNAVFGFWYDPFMKMWCITGTTIYLPYSKN